MAPPDSSVDGSDLKVSIDALRETVSHLAESMARSLAMQATFNGGPHEREAARRALIASSGPGGASPTAGMTTMQSVAYAARGSYEARQVASDWLANRIQGSTTVPTTTTGGGGGSGAGAGSGSAAPPPGPPVGQGQPLSVRRAAAEAIRTVGGSPNAGVAARALPGIGIATEAAGFFQSQRDQNSAFQRMEGGTSNLHGFGERFNEGMTTLRNLGMFSGADTSTLYRGATALGLDDRSDGKAVSRQGAMDFGYQAKSSMGMSPEESLQFLQTATRSATMSFSALVTSLEKVSETAGKAGVNADLMRQKVNTALNVGINSGMGGQAALSAATSMGNYQASLGRDSQNVDMSGRLGSNFQYMAASQSGMTLNQYQSALALDPLKAARARGVADKIALSTWLQPQYKQWIENQVASFGGPEALKNNPSLARSFWPMFQSQFPMADPNAMTSVVSGLTGQSNMTPEDAFSWIVQQIIGNTDESRVAADQAKMKITSGGIAAKDEGGLRNSFGSDFFGNQSAAANAYIDNSKSSGTRDPIVEAMLSKMNEKGFSQEDQKVVVMTSAGKRVVSMAEAVKSFSNQLASGQATFTGTGALNGQNISSLVGADMVDGSRSAAGIREANSAGAIGSEYSEDPNKGKDVTGKWMVDLTDDAKMWLKIVPQNPNYSGTPASGGSANSGRDAPAWTMNPDPFGGR